MTSDAFSEAKRPLRLGASIGCGGEGEVFALADEPARAIKIYDKPDVAREAKVRAMIAADLARSCPHAAFPQEVALGAGGSFVGFTMPLVKGCEPIHQLYSPASRRRVFPAADWRFLLRTAINLARVFDQIHAAGVTVGDINGSGVLVSRQAVVTLIDTDSFQFGTDHLCRVGVAEFTPPELHGRSLDGVIRTVEHDGFGLAVMIFQLLFLGRHPHAGVPAKRDLPLTQAITRGAFAYTAIRSTGLTPPPGTLLLSDLPLALRLLFERAFAIGLGSRPRAAEWAAELERLEAALTPCPVDRRHVRPRAVGDCPWCRIEDHTGQPVFGTGDRLRGGSPERAAPLDSIVTGTLRRAQRVAGTALHPPSPNREVRPSEKAVDCRRELDTKQRTSGPLRLQPSLTDQSDFAARYIKRRDRLAEEVERWSDQVGATSATRTAERLTAELNRLRQLEARQATALADTDSRLKARMVIDALTAVPLSDAKISGLGQRRLATMSAAGIGTAADITRECLARLPGLGGRVVAALLLWRDGLAVSAGRAATIAAEDIAAAKVEVERACRPAIIAAERSLHQLVGKLERELDEVASRSRKRNERIEEAKSAFDQAALDLALLGMDTPPAAPAAASADFATFRAQAAKAAGKKSGKNSKVIPGCPICDGRMLKRWTRSGSAFLGCIHHPRCHGTRPLRRKRP